MKFTSLSAASDFNPATYVAEEFLEGEHSNVRIIKLAKGTTLPPHKHGESDLMLYVAEGSPVLNTDEGDRQLSTGDLVFVAHHEELRISNQADPGVVLLAFLTPKFPPR